MGIKEDMFMKWTVLDLLFIFIIEIRGAAAENQWFCSCGFENFYKLKFFTVSMKLQLHPLLYATLKIIITIITPTRERRGRVSIVLPRS